jgi:hypothetical protein
MTIYGPQPPLTDVCPVCTNAVKVRENGTLWKHKRRPRSLEPCSGSGEEPKPGSVKRRKPPKGKRSVRTVSGGAMESNRRRH